MKTEFTTMVENLRQQEKRLQKSRDTFSNILQTSFLNTNAILKIDFAEIEKVAPAVGHVLETMAEITRRKDLLASDQGFEARILFYKVLHELRPMEVLGVPTRNFLCSFFNPVALLVHLVVCITYIPLTGVSMLLLLIGRINGLVAIMIGFACTTLAVIQLAETSTSIPPQKDNLALSRSYVAIITGVLAASQGIRKSVNSLYQSPDELTLDILRIVFGFDYPTDPVFQHFLDWRNWFATFNKTLGVKKSDIRKVQSVRMFLAVVERTSLVHGRNFDFELKDALTCIELRLLDPYNYLTLQSLGEGFKGETYSFATYHIKEVKEYYDRIASVESFCILLDDLNNENKVILPFHAKNGTPPSESEIPTCLLSDPAQEYLPNMTSQTETKSAYSHDVENQGPMINHLPRSNDQNKEELNKSE